LRTPNLIPYGRQWIDEEDIQAVVNVLRSDWLTTGPMVEAFEKAVAEFVGAKYAVALSSGTAALHAAMYATGVVQGTEVLVPPMTFVATANSVVFQGGTPVFVDVDPDTLLINPAQLRNKINSKTKAIIAVDYAGQPCDYNTLRNTVRRNNIALISDACHALGAKYFDKKVGSLADLTVFSFHPVKHITTGEGGMVVTDNLEYTERMRRFRNHGIASDFRQRAEKGTWYYEMLDLGYNYRLTDIQCALGLSQMHKLPAWISRRREIAKHYDEAFAKEPYAKALKVNENAFHVYHLYVIQLVLERLKTNRAAIFSSLRQAGIGVNVHYIPVHLHPYYRMRFGTAPGLCPVAESAYERILSLPMFPAMTDEDISKVIDTVKEILRLHSL
jgi:perosamine synthetase